LRGVAKVPDYIFQNALCFLERVASRFTIETKNQTGITMKKLLALAVLAASLHGAFAATSFFEATLTPEQDGGGARTGSGIGDFTLTDNSITYSISYSGLSGNSTAAHFHGPAAPGLNAPVLYGFGGPFGTTSGTLSGTINNLTATDLQQLNDGLWYANIHSTTFGGGEIRGQVLAVPEPGTVALLGLAGAMMVGLRKQRS
jgi:hypothetical protein